MTMCKQWRLVCSIQDASADDILVFLTRLYYANLIMLLWLSIVIIVAAAGNHRFGWLLAVCVVYVINVLSIRHLLGAASVRNTFLPMLSAIMLIVLNIGELLFDLARTHYHHFGALILILPISVQISTIYMTYRLREKLSAADIHASLLAEEHALYPQPPLMGEELSRSRTSPLIGIV